MARRKSISRKQSASKSATRPRNTRRTTPVPTHATTPTQDGFPLPPDVTSAKERLADGWAYVFRHRTLGLLGRLVLHEMQGSRTHISCEVAGDSADPMTAERAAIFQPLAVELVYLIEDRAGVTDGAPWAWIDPSPIATVSGEWVESKLMQCEHCDAGVALLLFADQATDHGGLEDYARKMYRQVQQTNLPTYVIGPALGGGPLMDRPADILKIWPERASVRRLRPDEFNPIIAELAQAHCS